jgi:acyl-CoA thioesterase-1
MTRRKRMWLFIGCVVGLLILFVTFQVVVAQKNAATFSPYWEELAAQPVPDNALRIVAMGNSAGEGIGADHPSESFVGLIASYVEERTNRPVHLTNISSGGATVEKIVERQVPAFDLKAADLVIITASTDMERFLSVEEYEKNLTRLIRELPADRTVFSDLPLWPGRAKYQAVLEHLTDEKGIVRADFATVFREKGQKLSVFSWSLPHLSSEGYGLWFEAFQPGVDKVITRSYPNTRKSFLFMRG